MSRARLPDFSNGGPSRVSVQETGTLNGGTSAIFIEQNGKGLGVRLRKAGVVA